MDSTHRARRAALGLLATAALSACGAGDTSMTAADSEAAAPSLEQRSSSDTVEDSTADDTIVDTARTNRSANGDDAGSGAAPAADRSFVGRQETFSDVPASDGLEPQRITIPAIEVDADVIDLGFNPDNTLEVPSDFSETGWFEHGSRPGEYGAAIIAGHIDSTDGPAVFFRLAELEEGEEIEVHSSDGDTVTFVVQSVEEYAKDDFPTQEVYSFTKEPTLRLITCGGPFDRTIGSYENNTIVFASRVA